MLKGAALLVMGTGGYALSQVTMLAGFAHLLGIEDVGRFSLALALTAPVMLLCNFGLRTLWITSADEPSFSLYLRLRSIGLLVGLALCFVIAFLYTDSPTMRAIILLVALSKAIENSADLKYAVLHRAERQDLVAICTLARGFTGAVVTLIAVWWTQSLVIGLIWYCISWFVISKLLDYRFAMRFVTDKSHEKLSLMPLFWLGVPPAIAVFLINLNVSFPRIVIEQVLGEAELGIYATLFYFIQFGSLIVNACGQAVLPRLSRFYAERKMKKHLKLVLSIVLGLALVSSSLFGAVHFIGAPVLDLMFGPEVAARVDVLKVLVLTSPCIFYVSMMGHVIVSVHRNVSLMTVQLATLIVNASLLFFLVPAYGLKGAVYAAAISATLTVFSLSVVYLGAIRAGGLIKGDQRSETLV